MSSSDKATNKSKNGDKTSNDKNESKRSSTISFANQDPGSVTNVLGLVISVLDWLKKNNNEGEDVKCPTVCQMNKALDKLHSVAHEIEKDKCGAGRRRCVCKDKWDDENNQFIDEDDETMVTCQPKCPSKFAKSECKANECKKCCASSEPIINCRNLDDDDGDKKKGLSIEEKCKICCDEDEKPEKTEKDDKKNEKDKDNDSQSSCDPNCKGTVFLVPGKPNEPIPKVTISLTTTRKPTPPVAKKNSSSSTAPCIVPCEQTCPKVKEVSRDCMTCCSEGAKSKKPPICHCGVQSPSVLSCSGLANRTNRSGVNTDDKRVQTQSNRPAYEPRKSSAYGAKLQLQRCIATSPAYAPPCAEDDLDEDEESCIDYLLQDPPDCLSYFPQFFSLPPPIQPYSRTYYGGVSIPPTYRRVPVDAGRTSPRTYRNQAPATSTPVANDCTSSLASDGTTNTESFSRIYAPCPPIDCGKRLVEAILQNPTEPAYQILRKIDLPCYEDEVMVQSDDLDSVKEASPVSIKRLTTVPGDCEKECDRPRTSTPKKP